jgi:hypothetical protein
VVKVNLNEQQLDYIENGINTFDYCPTYWARRLLDEVRRLKSEAEKL